MFPEVTHQAPFLIDVYTIILPLASLLRTAGWRLAVFLQQVK